MTPQSHNTPASTSQLAASPTLSTMSTAASTATTATAVSTAVTAITAAANAAGLGRVGGVVGQADKTSLLRFVVRSLWQHSQAIAELPEQLHGLKAAASVQVRGCAARTRPTVFLQADEPLTRLRTSYCD